MISRRITLLSDERMKSCCDIIAVMKIAYSYLMLIAAVLASACMQTSQASDRMSKLIASSAAQATVPKEFVAKDGSKLLYRWHEPSAKKPGEKYPLVVLLHGAGERGANNVSQLVWGAIPLFDYMRKKGREFYFVAGQVPKGKQWVDVPWRGFDHRLPEKPSETMTLLIELLSGLLESDPAIDLDRVYATGVSMGGYGTWDLISRKTEWFAAAMPICGGADVAQATKLRDLPVFIHHGDMDSAVPVWRSRSMIAALRNAGSHVARYTEYQGCGHDSWKPAYGDEKNFDWLFSKKRIKRPDWSPVAMRSEGLPAPGKNYEVVFEFSTDNGGTWNRGMVRRVPGFPISLVNDTVVTAPDFALSGLPNGRWTLIPSKKGASILFRDVKCRILPEW